MSGTSTPRPDNDPKPDETAPRDPRSGDGGPHPSIPQEDGPGIDETEGQPT